LMLLRLIILWTSL